jgi:DNA-binding response OmpR family regulator
MRTTAATVLVVEDDPTLRLMLQRLLEQEGYLVNVAGSGAAALVLAGETAPDLLVLDVGLPDMDGFDVMQRLRKTSTVPVLMLTGMDAPSDRVRGLDEGADDYLVKPASLPELAARVRALLRRQPASGSEIHAGELTIDIARRRVVRARDEVTLTRMEFDLLVYLLRRPRQEVTRDEILDQIWRDAPVQTSGIIAEYLHRIRGKVGRLPIAATDAGYRYDPPPA